MASVAKSAVSAVVVGLCAMACNNTPSPMQAIVASNVQPNPSSSAGCSSPETFVYLPETASVPGPDTNKDANITVTGTGDQVVQCAVQPSGDGYDVSLTAQITNPITGGTMTVTGHFTPRVRDATGNPSSDGTAISGIKVVFHDGTKNLVQNDCTAQYVTADNGSPGTSLPTQADVFADDKGGRIWASVFCPSPTNTLESQKPGNAGCMMSATFRFENCSNSLQ
jgi:hypothetical protein